MSKVKRKGIRCIYSLFRHLPLKKKTVLLFSYYGEQYSGSPKYIGKYLSANTDYRVVWAFVHPEKYQDVPGKRVRYGRAEYYLILATAETVITNYRMTEEFQMAKKDSEQLDMLLAGSKMSKEIFERAFWFDGKIAETGTPQCDILLHADTQAAKRVREYYRIPDGAHIAMYAPTFRKNHDTSVYDLNTDSLLKALQERFGGQWYLLMRLHPHLVHLTDCFHYTDHVLQATDYDDAQELLCATEFLISDYSAIMFDYAVTQRPCMLYTPDLQSYIAQDRDLYFNICELPFASFENQTEMLEAIREFDEKAYQQRLSRFLKKIGSYDDGNACKRVCELIKNGV